MRHTNLISSYCNRRANYSFLHISVQRIYHSKPFLNDLYEQKLIRFLYIWMVSENDYQDIDRERTLRYRNHLILGRMMTHARFKIGR